MKILMFIFLSLSVLIGQAQGVYRGSVLLNAYTGYPNFLGSGMPLSEPYASYGNFDYKGLAPSGLRLMYMAADDISIGLDFIYSAANGRVSKTDSVFFNGAWQANTTDYLIQKRQFRPQFRLDMHVYSSDPNLDQYIGLAIGGNQRWRKVFENGQLIDQNNDPNQINLPISIRACYGFRYFFQYNYAIGGEIGVGGPLLQLAFTYRI